MPYLKEKERMLYAKLVNELAERLSLAEGDEIGAHFNFIICSIAHKVCHKGSSYRHLERIVGAMELAKNEFIARRVRPYEDTKIVQNGDVFDTALDSYDQRLLQIEKTHDEDLQRDKRRQELL